MEKDTSSIMRKRGDHGEILPYLLEGRSLRCRSPGRGVFSVSRLGEG
jgi:hypothetical protein